MARWGLRERKELRYPFIAEPAGQWPVSVMCQVLQVSRSGYYAWMRRPVSPQQVRQAEIVAEIRNIHSDRDMHVYGSPRTHRELLNRCYEVCENTVAKLMNSEGIASSTTRKFRVNTTDSKHSLPIANNILDRDFHSRWTGAEGFIWPDLHHTSGGIFAPCLHD